VQATDMTPLLLALTGCTSVDGVWLFTLHVAPDAGEECVASVTHNFSGAAEPESDDDLDDDPWTRSTLTTWSPEAFFGLITETDAGAVLVVDGETYPGSPWDGGGWRFWWTHDVTVEDKDTHASGYAWSSWVSLADLVLFDLSFSAQMATGTVTSAADFDANYTESDAWSEDVADSVGTTGSIPSASYLVRDDGAGGSYPATNDWALTDCGSHPCTLGVTSSCGLEVGLDAELTDLDPAAFEGVDGAGQEGGS